MIEIEGEHNTATIMTGQSREDCEDKVIEQIENIVNHEAFAGDDNITICPDFHWGKGCVIGFTKPLDGRVCPNTVGVDIGCGMYAANFGDIEVDFEDVDERIHDAIPMGFDVNDRGSSIHMEDDFDWHRANGVLGDFVEARDDISMEDVAPYDIDYFESLCDRVGYDVGRAIASVGSLGGGNHFIELARSAENNDLWAIIHSGSRGLGNTTAQYWQEKATEYRNTDDMDIPWLLDPYIESDGEFRKERIRRDFGGKDIERVFSRLGQIRNGNDDRNKDLDYLEGDEAIGYYIDMIFCQQYASQSRAEMMERVAGAIGSEPIDYIESVHNFIDFRDQTIRKGATRAHEGERVIIPFNMRDGTLIASGKGNPEWNSSAPHGAGRIMGRREAKRELSMDEFESEMEGIYSTSISKSTLDEAPMAYKPTDAIEEVIGDTAEIIDRLEPVHNIKAED